MSRKNGLCTNLNYATSQWFMALPFSPVWRNPRLWKVKSRQSYTWSFHIDLSCSVSFKMKRCCSKLTFLYCNISLIIINIERNLSLMIQWYDDDAKNTKISRNSCLFKIVQLFSRRKQSAVFCCLGLKGIKSSVPRLTPRSFYFKHYSVTTTKTSSSFLK